MKKDTLTSKVTVNKRDFFLNPFTVGDMRSLIIQAEDDNKDNYYQTILAILKKCVSDKKGEIAWEKESEALVTYIFLQLQSISTLPPIGKTECENEKCQREINVEYKFKDSYLENEKSFEEKEIKISDKFKIFIKPISFESKISLESRLKNLEKFQEIRSRKSLKEKLEKFKQDFPEATEEDIEIEKMDLEEIHRRKSFKNLEIEKRVVEVVNSIYKTEELLEDGKVEVRLFDENDFFENISIVEKLTDKVVETILLEMENSPQVCLETKTICEFCKHENSFKVKGFESFL